MSVGYEFLSRPRAAGRGKGGLLSLAKKGLGRKVVVVVDLT